MIRFVHCVKRRPDISHEDFRRYWNSQKFADMLAELGAVTHAVRIKKNLTLLIDMNLELMKERGSDEPYDGILEAWWDNARLFSDDNPNAGKMEDFLREMETYQQQFIDFSQSRRFFTEWDPE